MTLDEFAAFCSWGAGVLVRGGPCCLLKFLPASTMFVYICPVNPVREFRVVVRNISVQLTDDYTYHRESQTKQQKIV